VSGEQKTVSDERLAVSGNADAWVKAIASDWRQAELNEPDRLLCELAEKLARDSHAVSDADIEGLRQAGFSEPAIHDAVQVIAYFSYINRVADALGVAPEAWLA
jgi:uncharacterized peroxidase-related enzyme